MLREDAVRGMERFWVGIGVCVEGLGAGAKLMDVIEPIMRLGFDLPSVDVFGIRHRRIGSYSLQLQLCIFYTEYTLNHLGAGGDPWPEEQCMEICFKLER